MSFAPGLGYLAGGLVMCSSVSFSVMFDSLQPMDCSPPGFSVGGISGQEYWSGLPFPFLGGLPGLLHCRQILCYLSHQGNPQTAEVGTCPLDLRRPAVPPVNRLSRDSSSPGKSCKQQTVSWWTVGSHSGARCPFWL